IAADKVAGIRASSITTPAFAELFRQHNNGNVVCLSGRFVDLAVNKEIVKTFLETPFEGGRHEGRVAKIAALQE
ncbi:MAG TPA: RpiB/LacA/LacB family sugar-phosphate isomerase, partial [Candidatus Coprousia avicola]|nr:RpiB/LacA/LacB family sugar-phosphate isomerase [Candidatus Coprousia avicola]